MRLLLACSIAVSICAAGALAQSGATIATRQVGTATLENVPEIPADVRAAVQRYQNYRAATFQDWLPDGSMLITTRFGATHQIHRVAAPGGARTQLTFQSEPVAGAHRDPGHAMRFVFGRDTGGDEWFQLYAAGLTARAAPAHRARHAQPVGRVQPRRQVCSPGRARPRAPPIMRSTSPIPPIRAARRASIAGHRRGRARRHFRRQRPGAVRAQHLQSRVAAVDARSRLRQGAQIAPKAGKVRYSSARFARDGRSVLAITDAGQRRRPAGRDRHRQRQGHRADAGSEVGRRGLTTLRRRSAARLCG